jgi:hypothetical protein
VPRFEPSISRKKSTALYLKQSDRFRVCYLWSCARAPSEIGQTELWLPAIVPSRVSSSPVTPLRGISRFATANSYTRVQWGVPSLVTQAFALITSLQSYMLSNDTSRPAVNAICHGWYAERVNHKPSSLYNKLHFTYQHQYTERRLIASSWPTFMRRVNARQFVAMVTRNCVIKKHSSHR